jgi:hypothetical protein
MVKRNLKKKFISVLIIAIARAKKKKFCLRQNSIVAALKTPFEKKIISFLLVLP